MEDGEETPRGRPRYSARDSMSPMGLWNEFGGTDVMKYLAFVDKAGDDVPVTYVQPQQVQTKSKSEELHGFPLPPTTSHRPIPPAKDMAKQTCEPRSPLIRTHRPHELELDDSRGLTSVSSSDLREFITKTKDSPTSTTSRLSVIQHETPLTPITGKGRKKYPQPLYSLTVHVPSPEQAMGNQQSHHSSTIDTSHTVAGAQYPSSEETGSSYDSVLEYSRLRPHKSGSRLAGIVKKKPIRNTSSKFTATVIEVPRAATAPNLDIIDDHVEELPEPPRAKHSKTLSAPSPALLSHPGSPDTITEESAARPLSAGTTITAHSVAGAEEPVSPRAARISALSPTIPTPSPVPEDSPHQYGLKDFTDTPSPPVDAKKAKRRSNGLDMFNDARSLQTAASFLNGLSNARRRAESRAESRAKQRNDHSKHNLTSASTTSLVYADHSIASNPAMRSQPNLVLTEPASPTYSSPPLTPKLDNMSRTLGHTHKSSGFAYAKALTVTQLQCYRGHQRLLRSGNTHYPVECAVCHSDEPGDYFWTCSWCATRMCGGCRNVFRQQGIKALRDKIRLAEYGSVAAQ